MYEAYFGLREKPFALTTNTGFAVKLAPCQACLNLLHVALARELLIEGAQSFIQRRRFCTQWQLVILTLLLIVASSGLRSLEYREALI